MKYLFDFGLSQEDPLTEQSVLDLRSGDSLLSLASGGEVPLSLAALNENLRITAVDISVTQIMLCRLKLTAALQLNFPLNGYFLGYAETEKSGRIGLYRGKIRPFLPEEDARFWDSHPEAIGRGVINAGRFEKYIRNMRIIVRLFMGGKNLEHLISCSTTEDQIRVFDEDIATRKSLQLLFKVAFHPAIYKKRGLQEQALIHAGKSTGERFYSKFRDFCTVNPASGNYFLQYFLTGSCRNETCFPSYLQPENRDRLTGNARQLEFSTDSFQDTLRKKGPGAFNKIHMSNLGDWITREQFLELLDLYSAFTQPGTIICYRYLQKNHFEENSAGPFLIDSGKGAKAGKLDRFPFYGIIPVTING